MILVLIIFKSKNLPSTGTGISTLRVPLILQKISPPFYRQRGSHQYMDSLVQNYFKYILKQLYSNYYCCVKSYPMTQHLETTIFSCLLPWIKSQRGSRGNVLSESQCPRSLLDVLHDYRQLQGWNLKSHGDIFTHVWQFLVAIDCVLRWTCWLQPQLHMAWASLQYGSLRVAELLKQHLQAPEAGISTNCREKMYQLSLPTLGNHGVTSLTFCWFRLRHKPVQVKGRKKRERIQTPSFNGRSVKDFCGHYFKPSKHRSNNF